VQKIKSIVASDLGQDLPEIDREHI